MELKLETEKFEKLQTIFIEEIIDDTSVIESDGVEVKPYLTFQRDEDEIIHCGENSYTYE